MKKRIFSRIIAGFMASTVILSSFGGMDCYSEAAADDYGREVDIAVREVDFEDWGSAYLQYIQDNYGDWGAYDKDRTFDLIYVDGDDIPEVAVSGSSEVEGTTIIYYSDGEAFSRNYYRHGLFYIEKSGMLAADCGHTGYYWTDIDKLWNGTIIDVANGEYSESLGADNNISYTYTWEGKDVTEDEYNRLKTSCFDFSKAKYINYTLPMSVTKIQDEIRKRCYRKAEAGWVRDYQEFLAGEKYLSMGQDYNTEYEVTGKFFDLDHDGIPELIMNNGYWNEMSSGYIYAWDNGQIKYLDNGPVYAYLDYDSLEEGYLFGYFNSSGYLSIYKKDGLDIKWEKVKEYDSQNKWKVDDEYSFLSNTSIGGLLAELYVYGQLKDGFSDPVCEVNSINEVIGEIPWSCWDYDYSKGFSAGYLTMFIYGYVYDFKRYNRGIETAYNTVNGVAPQADPKGKFSWGYRKLDGSGIDWILKNIYNVSSDEIDKLHDIDDYGYYYYDGDYYTGFGGVGGGYGSYINRVDDLGEVKGIGKVYQITYTQVEYPDGGWVNGYYKKYALMTHKLIDGKGYWSVYMTSDKPLYEEAEGLDPTPWSYYKYKPYKIVALKSKSNGCYVTCDIGSKNDKDEYEHFDEPELHMNATKIDAYEMFELVPCTDGSYALRSVMNRQFLTKDKSRGWSTGAGVLVHSYVYDDFIGDNTKLTLDLNSKYTKIKFKNSNNWLSYESGFLEPNSNESKAEEFEIIYLDDNEYTEGEKNILSSGEWFNIDGKGKGYWDIQNEIGEGKTDALETLGYTLMHLEGEDKKYIQYDNMQCAVGIKKSDGIYDVVVTFQGTGGFSGDKWSLIDMGEDLLASLLHNPFKDVKAHEGYCIMTAYFWRLENKIIAEIDGNKIKYSDLFLPKNREKVRFTILGHSMGGAMAQLYAVILEASGINPLYIKGRTFNSALAVTKDDNGNIFNDWYNICVSTDTVTNGLVTNSIVYHGVHRIGKTIWLYDNEPDQNTGGVGNISEPKHNMDQKLFEIMNTFSAAEGHYKINRVNNKNWIYITLKNNVPIYTEPRKTSEKMGAIIKKHTPVEIDGYLYNELGNRWYRTSDGGYIYMENIIGVMKLKVLDDQRYSIRCSRPNAPVYNMCYEDAEQTGQLPYQQKVNPKYAVRNTRNEIWVQIDEGWVRLEHLSMFDDFTGTRIVVDCPVDTELYDKAGNLVAKITMEGELESTDYSKVVPYMLGNIKVFDISGSEEYDLKINGRSIGKMDYTFYTGYDKEKGEFKAKKIFAAVDLEEGKHFESNISAEVEEVKLNVIDGNGNVTEEIEESIAAEPESDILQDEPGENDGPDGGSGGSGGGSSEESKTWLIFVFIGVLVIIAAAVLIIIVARKKKPIEQSAEKNIDKKTGLQSAGQQNSQLQSQSYEQNIRPQYHGPDAQQYQQPTAPQQPQQPQYQQPQQYISMYCPNCGAPLGGDQSFCGVCGTKRV